MKVILASKSPRRRELLAQIGLDFIIDPAFGEENIVSSDPREVVKELSAQKAEEIAQKNHEEALVIGSDTIVSLNDEIMGKPADKEEAFRMLKKLQGNSHSVYTGVTLIKLDLHGEEIKRISFYEETKVNFYPMSDGEIEAYIASGEPMDKAGAYGIQGAAAAYIKGIEGDYNNVVGLPVGRLYQEIKNL